MVATATPLGIAMRMTLSIQPMRSGSASHTDPDRRYFATELHSDHSASASLAGWISPGQGYGYASSGQ